MAKGYLVLGLFLPLLVLVLAQPTASGTIPASIQSFAQGELSSKNLPETTKPSAQTSAIHIAAQKQAPHTGNNYVFDPFGMIHNTINGQDDDDNESQRIKQTSTNKASETISNPATAKSTSSIGSASLSGHGTFPSMTGASTIAKSETSAIEASSSQPISSPSSSPTASASSTTTHKPANDELEGDYSSSTTMNSWKVIGIGVLSVIGVALLVVGTAFHDVIFRAICRPFRQRKDEEGVLVPDWRRASWRFADDGYGIEKPNFSGQDEEGPRIAEGEKENLVFPLPPVSPFPLRRAPSTSSRHPGESDIAGVGAGSTALMKLQGNNTALPSTPPASHAPYSKTENAKATHSPPASSRDHFESEAEAYGGMN